MQRTIFAALFGSLLLTTAACEQNSSEPAGVPIRVSAAVAAVVNGEPIYATDVELEAVGQAEITLPIDVKGRVDDLDISILSDHHVTMAIAALQGHPRASSLLSRGAS